MKIESPVILNDETLSELQTLQQEGIELDSELVDDLSYQLNNRE